MADRSFAAIRAIRTATFAAALCALSVAPAQPPSKAPEPKTGRNLDALKVPPGTVIVISDNPREAFQYVDAVVLSPDEYRKLIEAADQAKRPATPDKPEVPSVCRIGGKVETRGAQEVAVLRATYAFRTTAARTVVLLGLQKAKPTAAKLDGDKLPVLLPGKDDDSLSAQVDGAGEHTLTVDVEVPLATRGAKGGERGFELGLPGAAITAVEKLELPGGAARVRVGGRSVPARTLAQANAAYVVGPVPRLDVAWDVAAAGGSVDPVLNVDGVAEVRIDEKSATTHTRLSIKVQRGAAGDIRIQTPPESELTADGADPLVRVDRPKDSNKSVWFVRRDASAEELRLEVTTKSDVAPGKPIRVVLPSVADALQQRGTIVVGGSPALRLEFHVKPGAEVARRDGADDASRDTHFTYARVPDGPLVEVNATPLKGEVETAVAHQLTLTENGWRWQGKIDVRPIRTEAGHVDVELPAEMSDVRAASAEFVDSIRPLRDAAPQRKLVRLHLAESRRRPFAVTLEGTYPPATGATAASLMLPRVVGTADRGGSVAAAVPAGLELRAALFDWVNDSVGEWERPLDPGPRGPATAVTTIERAPARIDLSWRSSRGDAAMKATVNVFLGERQATVRHSWALPSASDSARKFTLRAPAALAGRLRAGEGCTVAAVAPGEWSLQASTGVFAVTYSFAIPADALSVPVPLAWLDPCPRCESELRVWAGPTHAPAWADGPWTELPPQPVADQPDLPTLSLSGSGSQLPLALGLRVLEATSRPVVERVWAQIVVDGDGQQAYRVRAWVRPTRGRPLPVELPFGTDPATVAVLVDGKRVAWTGDVFARRWMLPLESETGRRSRLVEIRYGCRPYDAGWRAVIDLPSFVAVEPPPIRIQVGFASDAVPLAWGEGVEVIESLGWKRGLPALRPTATTADLAAWFGGDRRKTAEGDVALAELFDGGLYATSATGGHLQLMAVPRPTLMLIASALALLVCGAVAAVGTTLVRSLLIGICAVGVATCAVLLPQPTERVVLAALPGLLVAPVVAAARTLARHRHRRRLLFLPGFSRGVPTRSSVTRGPGTPLPRREPSTVDSPGGAPEFSSSRQVVR